MRQQLHEPPGVSGFYTEEAYFRNQFYLWLAGTLGEHWFTDFIGRYVDQVDGNIPSYFVMDVRLAYRPRTNLEYAVVGRNLLEGVHTEWKGRGLLCLEGTHVEQEVYGSITYRF